jgi:hypothetical protein
VVRSWARYGEAQEYLWSRKLELSLNRKAEA